MGDQEMEEVKVFRTETDDGEILDDLFELGLAEIQQFSHLKGF